jgi:hypothetical protein
MMTPCSRCIHCPPGPGVATLRKEHPEELRDWQGECENGEPVYLQWYQLPGLNLQGYVVAPRTVDPNKCQWFTPPRPPNRFDKILMGDDYLFDLR